jgi:hypothetical protein
MRYQLANGKVINITIEQYLSLSDEDIQYLISQDAGEQAIDPFEESEVIEHKHSKHYDFDYLSDDDEETKTTDDHPFDDIIDLSDSLDY